MSSYEGLPLELERICRLGVLDADGPSWHTARIITIEPRRLWVQSPPELDQRLPSLRGEVVILEAWRPADAQYTSHARVLEIDWGPPPQIGLQVHRSTRVQRRAYVRVSVSIPVEHAFLRDADGQTASVRMFVRDLSATGARALISSLPGTQGAVTIAQGSTLDLALPLRSPEDTVLLAAQVQRVSAVEHPLLYRHEIGLQFIDVPPATRERLIRFVLQVQYELARKGVLGC